MTQEPRWAHKTTYKKPNCLIMHRKIVKSSHFRRFKRYNTNVIFKGINFKLCTHASQCTLQNMCYGFLKILKNFKFGEQNKILVIKYTFRTFFTISKIRDSSFVAPCIYFIFSKRRFTLV